MFSKILIKLIDQAIIPALLLVTVRLVSIVLFSYQLGIPLDLAQNGFAFNTMAQYKDINSRSLMAMIACLALGVAYILLKSWAFHSSHISPKTTARLFSLKLSFFIQNSYNLYSQGAIWVSYLFLLVLTAGAMTVFGLVFPWVFIVGLAFTILATVLFVIDIEREINLSSDNEDLGYPEDDQETFVLKFGEDYV